MDTGLYIFDAHTEWASNPQVAAVLRPMPWGTIHFGIAANHDQIAPAGMTEAATRAMLMDMITKVTGGHRPPDEAVRICAHRRDDYCSCLKPAPGMLVAICRHYDVPQHAALFVGDTDIDEMAAARAGVRFQWAANFFGRPART